MNEIGPTVSDDEARGPLWEWVGQIFAAKIIADWLFAWLRRHFDL
ncbi:hypothetical protein ACFYT3_10055 [Nocardia amikacinitolerans]